MKAALWMMSRFAVDPSLTGDLTEEWSTGHTSFWLLRQTLIAIRSAIWSGLWHHKLRTLAAVATGLIGWFLLAIGFHYGIHALGFQNFPVGLLLFILRPILLGWIVGKLQPTQPLGTSILYIATFLAVMLSMSYGHLRPPDYVPVLLIASWLTLTSMAGGLLTTRNPKLFQSMANTPAPEA
jgi:hypothetical protein